MNAYYALSLLAVAIAAMVDTYANYLLVKSEGFTRLGYTLGTLFFVNLAFTLMYFSLGELDLAVAYVLWGGLGLVGTALIGKFIFRHRITWEGAVGILLLIVGMVLIQTH